MIPEQCNVCFVVLFPVGGEHEGHSQIGLWVLTGLLTFMVIEKIFPESGKDEDSEDNSAVSIYVHFLWFCIKHVCICIILYGCQPCFGQV